MNAPVSSSGTEINLHKQSVSKHLLVELTPFSDYVTQNSRLQLSLPPHCLFQLSPGTVAVFCICVNNWYVHPPVSLLFAGSDGTGGGRGGVAAKSNDTEQ